MAFQARRHLDQIRSVVDEKIVPALQGLDGVSSVEVYGGRRRSVEVLLDPKALETFNLTAGQIAARIAEQSGRREYLGRAMDRQKKYFVNLISQYASLPNLGDGRQGRQADPVAARRDDPRGSAERTTISRIDGQEAVSVPCRGLLEPHRPARRAASCRTSANGLPDGEPGGRPTRPRS
jgi:multidrug efflux pump subunit AcrB